MATKQAKEAEDWLQCLVFGYMRLTQKLNVSLNLIPIDIYYLCISYLAVIEYFDIIGPAIVRSEDKTTITKSNTGWRWVRYNDWDNTNYGKNEILSTSKKIIKWIIECNYSSTQGFEANMCIGITSNFNSEDRDWTLCSQMEPFYAITNQGARYESIYDTESILVDKYLSGYKSGHKVTITLNLKNATIAIGDEIVWNNVKIDESVSYKFAASIRSKPDSVSIVGFVEI